MESNLGWMSFSLNKYQWVCAGYGGITAHAAFRSLSFSVLTVGYLEAVEKETSFTEIPASAGIFFFTCLKLVP